MIGLFKAICLIFIVYIIVCVFVVASVCVFFCVLFVFQRCVCVYFLVMCFYYYGVLVCFKKVFLYDLFVLNLCFLGDCVYYLIFCVLFCVD